MHRTDFKTHASLTPRATVGATTTRRTLCDSNFGERDKSFAPLVAIGHPDGSVTVINTAAPRGRGYEHEAYPTIESAAESRGFIRRWMAA